MQTTQQQLAKAERAYYRAKAAVEKAVDHLSDCGSKVARLREKLNDLPDNLSEPLKSIDRPGPRKDARKALWKFGA